MQPGETLTEQRALVTAVRDAMADHRGRLAAAQAAAEADESAATADLDSERRRAADALADAAGPATALEARIAGSRWSQVLGNARAAAAQLPESPEADPARQIQACGSRIKAQAPYLGAQLFGGAGQPASTSAIIWGWLGITAAAFVLMVIVLAQAGGAAWVLAFVGAPVAGALLVNWIVSAAHVSKRTALGSLRHQVSWATAWYERWTGSAEAVWRERTAAARSRHEAAVVDARRSLQLAMERLRPALEAHYERAEALSPAWTNPDWPDWTPQSELPEALRLGRLAFDVDGDTLLVPYLVPFPGQRSVLVRATGDARAEAAAAVRSLLARMLAQVPPGKLRFTFIDPVGLGQNVAPFMHLGDHQEELITARAWSEPQHIEARLAELTEHMENVIQKYLRSQFASIEEYNEQAGEIAEPYRVLVLFDFPVNLSETAARRLVSIAANGPRCGVYTVVLHDPAQPLPYGFNPQDLDRSTQVVTGAEGRFLLEHEDLGAWPIVLDGAPAVELTDRIVAGVGAMAREASRVEVPFERIAPPRAGWWSGDARDGFTLPLGPAGARRTQCLELGQGTSQHVLVVGKTGSGKSTLLHTVITSLALAYGPDEAWLYLIDFKKGVEFKAYASQQLAHARVVAVESEREFGLSVLQGLDAELKRRGDLLRANGADSLGDYRRKTGEPMARILLLVDEFQEFFSEDDSIASLAAQILDRLVRQGRAFGIHVLLGSQTLAGAYSLARSTIDQMAVRVALQCSEADSRLILSDDNPAARLLSRPGEAIYNAANGLVEGNHPFQVAWLPDEQRDAYLRQLRAMAGARGHHAAPVVFEGNALATVDDCRPLNGLLRGAGPAAGSTPLVWVGDPVAIREPVATPFRRQSAANLLIVGQNDEAAAGIMAAGLVALCAQLDGDDGQPPLDVLDFGLADAPHAGLFAALADGLGGRVAVGGRRNLPAVVGELAADVERRMEAETAAHPPRFLFVYGLQRARDLRLEDGYGLGGFGGLGDEPAAPSLPSQFATIVREGPEVGVHTIVWCDTATNLARTLDRRTLREFAMRVVFQMSAEDSANLVDTPAASKLGQHRALLYSEDEGRVEKFQPYAVPSAAWLQRVGAGVREEVAGHQLRG